MRRLTIDREKDVDCRFCVNDRARWRDIVLEYSCSVYIDPNTGDIYGVNNDTMGWLVMFDRSAKGDLPPTGELAVPHTTYGIAMDEQAQEVFLTIQDDYATGTETTIRRAFCGASCNDF